MPHAKAQFSTATLTATYASSVSIHDVTASQTASGSTYVSLTFGWDDELVFTVTPSGGHVFSYMTDGYNIYYDNPLTLSGMQTEGFDINMVATLSNTGGATYHIAASISGAAGTITPSGSVAVTQGTSQQFTWSVPTGYFVSSVTVDSNPNVNVNSSSYTFTNVQSDHTITVYTEVQTSPTGECQYTFQGPYYDNGLIDTSDTATITLYWENGVITTYDLTYPAGISGLSKNTNAPITSVTWNASSTQNFTRKIDMFPQSQTVRIFVPNPSTPSQLYTFPVVDYSGMTNAYLQTRVSIGGGATYVVEQANLDTANVPSFTLQQFQTYIMTFVCDQGTYTQQFTSGTTYSNNLIVPSNVFQTTNTSYPIADAERVNETEIAIVYIDPSLSTLGVNVSITHQFGSTTINDYTVTNNLGNSQTILWNSADPQTSYTVTVSASISNTSSAYGTNPTWTFTVPITAPTNPWLGVFDFLGQNVNTLPYTPTGWTTASGAQMTPGTIAEIVGISIIILFLCVGSYQSSGAACIICWIMSGFLIYLGWWANGVVGGVGAIPSFVLCGFVAILVHINEGKDTARET